MSEEASAKRQRVPAHKNKPTLMNIGQKPSMAPSMQEEAKAGAAKEAAVFQADEVIVYEDEMNPSRDKRTWDPNLFLAHILQYLETPPYLRKALIPQHRDLRLVGLLHYLDMPHHLRATEAAPYRDGVTVKRPTKGGKGTLVHIGLQREAYIPQRIPAGTRVTVALDSDDVCDPPAAFQATMKKKRVTGRAVHPSEPRIKSGMYWGYTVRVVPSFASILTDCPYEGGYDLTVGVSEKATVSTEDVSFQLPKFRHGLVIFGGVKDLEQIVEGSDELDLAPADIPKLFDAYVNTCPARGSRTVRTEESVLISLAALKPFLNHPGPEISKRRKELWGENTGPQTKNPEFWTRSAWQPDFN